VFRTLARLLAATVVTAAVVGGVLLLRDSPSATPEQAAPSSTPEPTPAPSLADVDTTSLVVARTGFCDRVADDAVTAALGARATGGNAYGNGERAVLADGVEDVAHEFGCVWTAGDAEARAWVFAPPVSPSDAQALRKAAGAQDGCRASDGAAAFGEPGVALVCRTPAGPVASYRGLFGDAWLACSVGGASRQDAVGRADRWCAAVAVAAGSAD
jgi:hypothetical protein